MNRKNVKTQIKNKNIFFLNNIFFVYFDIPTGKSYIKMSQIHTISSVTIHQSFDKIKSACFHYILLVLQRGCYDKDEKFSTKCRKIFYMISYLYREFASE